MTRPVPEFEIEDDYAWLAHYTPRDADVELLRGVRWIEAWNVRFPPAFLAELPQLELIDLRGGSRDDLGLLHGCGALRGLVVNQVRGLSDLSTIAELVTLEYLQLYGLAQVQALPALDQLPSLRRVDLGQMRSLKGWSALAQTPQLEELCFINILDPDDAVIDELEAHPRLREFYWFADNGPSVRRWTEVARRIGRPPAQAAHAHGWLWPPE